MSKYNVSFISFHLSSLCFVCFNLSFFFLQEGRVSSDGVSGVGCILVLGLSSLPINYGMIKHVLHNILMTGRVKGWHGLS